MNEWSPVVLTCPGSAQSRGQVCKGSEKSEQILRTQVEIGELKVQKDTLERVRKRHPQEEPCALPYLEGFQKATI